MKNQQRVCCREKRTSSNVIWFHLISCPIHFISFYIILWLLMLLQVTAFLQLDLTLVFLRMQMSGRGIFSRQLIRSRKKERKQWRRWGLRECDGKVCWKKKKDGLHNRDPPSCTPFCPSSTSETLASVMTHDVRMTTLPAPSPRKTKKNAYFSDMTDLHCPAKKEEGNIKKKKKQEGTERNIE